jgi:hypothetical protein
MSVRAFLFYQGQFFWFTAWRLVGGRREFQKPTFPLFTVVINW